MAPSSLLPLLTKRFGFGIQFLTRRGDPYRSIVSHCKATSNIQHKHNTYGETRHSNALSHLRALKAARHATASTQQHMRRKLQNAQIETRAVHTQQSTHKKNKGKSTNNAAATNQKSTDTHTHTLCKQKYTSTILTTRQAATQAAAAQTAKRARWWDGMVERGKGIKIG